MLVLDPLNYQAEFQVGWEDSEKEENQIIR